MQSNGIHNVIHCTWEDKVFRSSIACVCYNYSGTSGKGHSNKGHFLMYQHFLPLKEDKPLYNGQNDPFIGSTVTVFCRLFWMVSLPTRWRWRTQCGMLIERPVLCVSTWRRRRRLCGNRLLEGEEGIDLTKVSSMQHSSVHLQIKEAIARAVPVLENSMFPLRSCSYAELVQ